MLYSWWPDALDLHASATTHIRQCSYRMSTITLSPWLSTIRSYMKPTTSDVLWALTVLALAFLLHLIFGG